MGLEPIIIARAPLSISLGEYVAAGGPDTGSPCGSAIRAAIGYYAYTIVTSGSGVGLHFTLAGGAGVPGNVPAGAPQGSGQPRWLEAIAREFSAREGLEVFLAPQLPLGAGLGVPASVAVSATKALAFCSGVDLDPGDVIDLAFSVAPELLQSPSACAALYAAAYGGLMCLEATAGGTPAAAIALPDAAWQQLERALMIFIHHDGLSTAGLQVGVSQPSGSVCLPVGESDAPANWSVAVRQALMTADLLRLGQLWCTGRPAQSDAAPADVVRHCCRSALDGGALGVRSASVSGGAALTVLCRDRWQDDVCEALAAVGMVRWPLKLARNGVEILEPAPRVWSGVISGLTGSRTASHRVPQF